MTAAILRIVTIVLLLTLVAPTAHLTVAPFSSPASAAENPFEIVAVVNDQAITRYEVSQRKRFLELFKLVDEQNGDSETQALEELIDDRVRFSEMEKYGLSLDDASVDAGVSNVAAQQNMSIEQLEAHVMDGGVHPDTLRAYVRAALGWERLVSVRFGGTAAITEQEVDAALSLASEESEQMILLSEIILVAGERGMQQTETIAWRLYELIDDENGFAAAARRFSNSPSRQTGGRLEWQSVRTIPPQILPRLLALSPGQLSGPIRIDDTAIGLFLLRGIRGGQPVERKPPTVTFLNVPLSSNWSEDDIGTLIDASENCDDLQVAVLDLDSEVVVEPSTLGNETPEPLTQAISRLDLGEASVHAGADGARSLIMVCDRSGQGSAELRERVRRNLFIQRLSGLGNSYLSRLRSEAFIEYK